jgi:ATP synthase F1 complex assembly factor 1
LLFREGLTVEELKQKIKDEAAKKLRAAKPKKIEPKVVVETTKKASASTIAAKSQLPYDSSAPVCFNQKETIWRKTNRSQ